MTARGQGTPLACATNARNALNSKWGKHLKSCGKCIVTTASKRCFCDEGWEIVRELQLARAKVAELQEQLAEEYPHLF